MHRLAKIIAGALLASVLGVAGISQAAASAD